MELNKLIEGGGLIMVQIAHDDWCKTLKTGNGSDCNCNPVESAKKLEGDGEIEEYFRELGYPFPVK